MKLHLGCGPVYLKDFVNIDSCPDFLASENPEAAKKNETTVDNYYKFPFGSNTTVVADVESCITKLKFHNESCDEVVMFHVLEHFPKYEVGLVISEIHRVLKNNGIFYVAVPDIIETARQLLDSKTVEEENWCIRLIEGTQKNKYFHHFCHYSERTLKELLKQYGFGNFVKMENQNFYPAIHLKAQKIKKF